MTSDFKKPLRLFSYVLSLMTAERLLEECVSLTDGDTQELAVKLFNGSFGEWCPESAAKVVPTQAAPADH